MGLSEIRGVQSKGGSYYRRFKVKREGRWVDLYVKLPRPGEPGFRKALAKANAAARAGALDGRAIRAKDISHNV